MEGDEPAPGLHCAHNWLHGGDFSGMGLGEVEESVSRGEVCD